MRFRLPRNSQRMAALTVAILAATAVGVVFAGSPASSKGTIEIGSDVPTFVEDRLAGLPTQYGAGFAVAQAGSVRGFMLKFVPFEVPKSPMWDTRKGLVMMADQNLLGIVGPFASDGAAAEIPVANRAALAMISPTATDHCLTALVEFGCPAYDPTWLRPTGKNNFFRLAAADAFQGQAMADFAYNTLGLRQIAVWDDQRTYGVVMADSFAIAFTKKGGTVVARQGFDTMISPDFHAWLVQARAGGAQAIYAGTTSATEGCVPLQESQGIFPLDSYYLGPDLLANLLCTNVPGELAKDRIYVSVGVGDANLNPNAAATIAAYERAHPDPADTNASTFASYDCAAILIDAIGHAIDANDGKMPTRQQVVDQVAKTTNYKGLTGTYTFNASGEPTTPTVQILQYKGRDWTPITNLTVAGS